MTNKRVRMEPELEGIAGTWTGEQRLASARKLRRWAAQLEKTGLILIADANRRPWARKRVKVLPRAILARN